MTDEERQACFAMDESQAMWVADVQQRLAEAEAEHLGGRTSGTADWRARRAELGKAVSRPTFVGEWTCATSTKAPLRLLDASGGTQ